MFIRILFSAALLGSASVARAAVLFDQTPVLYNPQFQRGVNWQSKGGVPLSSTAGSPAGSNGRAPSDTTPTPRQFSGGIVYGAVTYQKSANLAGGSFPANARRENLNWPRIENSDGTIRMVLRAQSGAPYMMRAIAFFFGSVISTPEVNESGSLLAAVNLQTYWAAEPHSTTGHSGANYYWSPHAQRVYATQPGRIDIIWRKRTGVSDAEKVTGVSYASIGGLNYALLSTNYLVSGATVKTPRRIYWTEGRYRETGKPVNVPAARVGDVKIVYHSGFPEFVGKENAIFVEGDEPYITNRTDRTLWYDATTTRQILARNKEGRVFVELLGDLRGTGPHRNQLGFEIVDVVRQPTPSDVTIELGEILTPPGTPESELFPEPVLSSIGKNFAFQHSVAGSDRIELYATRETKNLNDYQVFWMEESIAGLRWPSMLARYRLIWPDSPAKFSHYVRPSADQEEAKKTSVLLPTENVPVIEYQDLDPRGNARASLTEDFKFFTFLDSTIPAHRTLLRFSAGDNIGFERVFSVLDSSVKAAGFDGTRERAINSTHYEGPGVSPALDLSPSLGNAYGQLPSGVYFDGGSFTVESWVFVRSHRSWARLFDFGAGPLQDVVAMSLSTDTEVKPAFVTQSGSTGINVVAPKALPLNQWVHLAVVFQAGTGANTGTGTIYFNGVSQVSQSGMAIPRNVTRANAWVGRSNLASDAYPDAMFDNFRIWSGVRTPEQLAAGMKSTYSPRTASLMAQFQFGDEGTGSNPSVAPDSSGNERTMTLFNTSLPFTPTVNSTVRARFEESSAYVGQRLVPPDGEATSGVNLPYLAGYINQSQGTAFSVTAYRDPFLVGFEAAAGGSIIPVNAGANNSARLEVWWYRRNSANLARGFHTIYWPSIISRYSVQWPTAAPFTREIILASNDGSGALGSLEAKGKIYYQNDSSKPGYNPNEEHALMLGGQAYALRDDLNVIRGASYSSNPYVLLEYSAGDGRPSMTVFQLFREKENVKFAFGITAGTPLQAPMPLPFMELPIPEGVNNLSANLNTEVQGRLIAENTVPLTQPVTDGAKEHSVTLKTTVGHRFATGDVFVLQDGNSEAGVLYFFSGDGVEFPDKLHGLVSATEPARITSAAPASFSGKPSTLDGYSLIVGDASTEGDQAPRAVFVSNTSNHFQGFQVDDMVWLVARRGAPRSERHLLKVVAVNSAAKSVTLEFTDQFAQSLGAKSSSNQYVYERAEANGLKTTAARTFVRYDLSKFSRFDLVVKPKTDVAQDALKDRRMISELLPPGVNVVTSPTSSTAERDELYKKLLLKDRKGTFWVYRGPHAASDSAQFQVQWFYKTLEGFYFPDLGFNSQPPVGVLAPYLRRIGVNGEPIGPSFLASGSQPSTLDPLTVTYRARWPENTPSLFWGETLTNPKRGLPAVRGNTSLEIVYEQSLSQSPSLDSAILFDGTREKEYQLGQPGGLTKIPLSIATSQFQGKTFFPRLPPHLQERFFFDPNRGAKGALVLRGKFVDEALGEDYLLLNVLGESEGTAPSDLKSVKALAINEDQDKAAWDSAIEALTTRLELFVEDVNRPGTYGVGSFKNYTATQAAEVVNDDEAVDSYALSAAGPGSGFVTLIRGNGRAFTPISDPVDLQIFRVEPSLYVGEIKIILSANPLSEQVTFQHTADLGGKVGDFEYEWKIAPPVDGLPLAVARTADDPGTGWLAAQDGSGRAKPRYVLGGTGVQTLSDNYVIVHYRPKDPNHPLRDQWSDWTEPQLAEGWIKRVLAGINPFNQRVTDLFNNRVNTDVSILTQAGARWEGDVALNLEAVQKAGLIEIYETVLRRGKVLSIESGINFGPANDALLLAAGYLNDLYMMIGNEAWADAANPTISIGTKDRTFGDIATALFSFKGQMASLLEEELALLRGRDDFLQPGVEVSPVYNRLFWNYTRGIDSGEVIYALNYNIQENNDSGVNGVINADDARKMFPQGHGDAYGHYLTALKNYYTLMMDTDFDWVPRIEAVTVLGKAVSVDYQDERKFAAAAAAVARAGRQVFDLSWRRDFKPGANAGWRHFAETRTNTRRKVETTRHWGIDHWAARTGQGAYLNWALGNSILPDVDPDPSHEGIQKVDRTTVPELKELSTISDDLQTALDNAEGRLTPLGLAEGSLAFDLNPTQITGPAAQTHFEQIYGRAKLALNNALAAFDDTKDVTRLLRSEQDSLADLQSSIANQELAYSNALIELYGTPYPDDIGAGKTYPQGFNGPDLIHYSYVDTPELVFPGLLDPAEEVTFKIDIQSLPEARILGLQTEFNDVLSRTDPAYSNSVHYIEFVLSPHGYFGKPRQWASRRVSPGRIQQAISEIIKARNLVRQALDDMDGQKDELDGAVRLFKEAVRTTDRISALERDKYIAEFVTQGVEVANDIFQDAQESVEDQILKSVDVIKESLPRSLIAGLAAGGDLTAPARGAVEAGGVISETALEIIANIADAATKLLRLANDQAAAGVDLFQITPLSNAQEFRERVYELTLQFNAIQDGFSTLNARIQALDDAKRQLQALIAEGDRVQAEREMFRQRSAALVQGFRTRDAAFRVFRNEKLERYKTLFDLAARYVFLAANAYDYETGLLHTQQGKEFINRIVNARALGVVRNSEPQFAGSNTGDPGLSSVLAEMRADFEVLKGRLGFNNPNSYATTVSLRLEKERIIPAADGDSSWQDVLERARRANILDDSDVRRYCMQVDSGNGLPVPGIVLEFATAIENGVNLFGQALASGDHYFDTSLFATKLFGVGVAFEGYVGMDNPAANSSAVNAAGGVSPPDPNTSFLSPNALAATPGIYLIPVGVDSMRSPPLGDASQVRSWAVDDVAIPLPFNIGGSELSSKALWQSSQSLTEQLFAVRKHQAFRPVSTTAAFANDIYSGNTLRLSQFTNNRLIGRSVWNSKWKLVIPGHKLLGNPNEGLDRFIQTVKDIKLHFVTYSYAGN